MPLGRKFFAPNAPPDERRASDVALDFIRMNLFDRTRMNIFPGHLNGAHNDLNETIDDLLADLIGNEDRLISPSATPGSTRTRMKR